MERVGLDAPLGDAGLVRQGTVVVGYDGSDPARDAVAWAARVAQRRNVPLLVLSATGGESSGLGLRRAKVLELREQRARRAAAEGAEIAQHVADIEVDSTVAETGPVEALVQESAEAGLVVVGHRSMGALRGALLGSVAFGVMAHAESPVAVVRGPLRSLPSEEHPIVVGVDGSEASYVALEEAAGLGVDTGASLRIVVAWRELAPELSDTAYEIDEEGRALPGQRDPWQRTDRASLLDELSAGVVKEAHDIAEAAMAHARQKYAGLALLEPVVRQGESDDVLLDAAIDAGLIVVGARGHSNFTNLLIGSTSQRVIQRAPCAVFVVR